MSWVTIYEHKVRMIFQCEDEDCPCGNEEVELYPCEVKNTGNPICSETGSDLEYLRVEVNTDFLD